MNRRSVSKPDNVEFKHILGGLIPEDMITDVKICSLFKNALADVEGKASTTITILQNIEHCMTMLKDDHKSLVKTIMNMNWLNRGPELTQVYHSFMLNLLSTHSNYFKPYLIILIKKFREDYKFTEAVDKENLRLKMEQDFQHCHALLESLCRLIPMTTVVLLSLLEELYPYVTKGIMVHEVYTSNLLKITSYLPSLRKDILDLIVKNMLKLDVRITREALSNACVEETVEDDPEDIFSMEVGCDVKPKSHEIEAGDKLAKLLPQAASLDSVMVLMLNYIKNTCYPGGNFDWAVTKTLYRELLSSFDKYVFPTYLANHTQFIMFYICSFKEALVDGFSDYLWKKVTNPMSQPIYRQIGACYIGSFLTRANYIPVSTAQTLMKLMMNWVHNYLDETCDINMKVDIEHHSAFYSVCQTCFYIFCFKHTQFVHMKNGQKWLETLNFQRVVTSKLNPLKHCLSIIVKTFASATRTHQLAFCDTIVERNNRYSLPISSSYAFESCKQLYSFFPFDPYLLKRSGSFIVPLYKEFQGNISEEEDVENEDEDDFLPDDDIHLNSHDPLGMSVEKNTVDLLHYSVSPGFQD